MLKCGAAVAVAILIVAGSAWRASACEGKEIVFEDDFKDDAGGWAINKDVEVHEESGLAPYLGPFEGPYADAAREALRFGFGASPAFIREGGSIGAVMTMHTHLKAPILMIGLSLPEHGYHAPNENYDWGQASGGIKSFVKYFSDIAVLR